MHVLYQRLLPHPPERVLSQYFDLEHLRSVHGRTFGHPRVLATTETAVTWRFGFPVCGVRLPITIAQQYRPPNQVLSSVIGGLFRGTIVSTHLRPEPAGTLLVERYEISFPAIPVLSWLARLALVRWLDKVWDEDIRVGMPYGGWPGVPGGSERND